MNTAQIEKSKSLLGNSAVEMLLQSIKTPCGFWKTWAWDANSRKCSRSLRSLKQKGWPPSMKIEFIPCATWWKNVLKPPLG